MTDPIMASLARQDEFYRTHDRTIPCRPDADDLRIPTVRLVLKELHDQYTAGAAVFLNADEAAASGYQGETVVLTEVLADIMQEI